MKSYDLPGIKLINVHIWAQNNINHCVIVQISCNNDNQRIFSIYDDTLSASNYPCKAINNSLSMYGKILTMHLHQNITAPVYPQSMLQGMTSMEAILSAITVRFNPKILVDGRPHTLSEPWLTGGPEPCPFKLFHQNYSLYVSLYLCSPWQQLQLLIWTRIRLTAYILKYWPINLEILEVAREHGATCWDQVCTIRIVVPNL